MDDKTTTLAGQFLLAVPSIDDARFTRSVIYMTEHDSEGALGYVLNKPADDKVLQDILVKMPPQLKNTAAEQLPVFVGGPVQGEHGYILYAEGADNHLVASTSLGVLVRAVKDGERPLPPMRLMLGCATWEGGQLENELRQNIWLTLSPPLLKSETQNILAVEPATLYDHCLDALGVDVSAISNQGGLA